MFSRFPLFTLKHENVVRFLFVIVHEYVWARLEVDISDNLSKEPLRTDFILCLLSEVKTEGHPEFEVGRGSEYLEPDHNILQTPPSLFFTPIHKITHPSEWSIIFFLLMQSILPQLHHYQLSNEKRRGEGCGKRNFTLHNCGTCHFCWCQTFPAISKASLSWIVFGKIESRGTECTKRERIFSLGEMTMLIIHFRNIF